MDLERIIAALYVQAYISKHLYLCFDKSTKIHTISILHCNKRLNHIHMRSLYDGKFFFKWNLPISEWPCSINQRGVENTTKFNTTRSESWSRTDCAKSMTAVDMSEKFHLEFQTLCWQDLIFLDFWQMIFKQKELSYSVWPNPNWQAKPLSRKEIQSLWPFICYLTNPFLLSPTMCFVANIILMLAFKHACIKACQSSPLLRLYENIWHRREKKYFL